MSWGCHWNCCAKNWRYWDNGGAGCGPRDGRRIKHEGAKTRSDDVVIHRLHRLHRLNDDDFLPQGTQRNAED